MCDASETGREGHITAHYDTLDRRFRCPSSEPDPQIKPPVIQ